MRGTRATVLAAVLLLAGLLLPAGVAAHVPRAATCERPAHTKLLAGDPRLRAWVRYGVTLSVVDVCAPAHGRVRQAWSSAADPYFSSISRVDSDGPVIGFLANDVNQDGSTSTLLVFAANGQRLLDTTVANLLDGEPQPLPGFDGYVIDATGDVAWVETNANGVAGSGETLFLETAAGQQTLATAPSITGVSIAGGEVAWQAGGVPGSAPLP
jgi:hypothetical protein